MAQDKKTAFPLLDEAARVSSVFGAYGGGDVTDPKTYLPGQLHLGVDLQATTGAAVLAPASGKIIYYHRLSNRSPEPQWMNTFIVLRDEAGHDWILAHMECTVCDQNIVIGDAGIWPVDKQVTVVVGQRIGKIADLRAEATALDLPYKQFIGNHLHLGAVKARVVDDQGSLLPVFRNGNWGRISYSGHDADGGPASAKRAAQTGFIDTLALLQSGDDADEDSSSEWGPALVAGADIGYLPCGEKRASDSCLRELGLGRQAIAFSQAIDGDYSGASVGISFTELGSVDLAVAQFIGADVYYLPVLLNGPLSFHGVEQTQELRETFRDSASQKMLSRFPNAFTSGLDIRSHRVTPDGTQRFVLMEGVVDGCRACDILGSAVTYLEIGPATGGRVIRRPIGLFLGPPEQTVDEMTPGMFSTMPSSLQLWLNSLGYEAGMMDGFPGPQTRQALMTFQVEHCLSPTGQPDVGTSNALLATDGFNRPCTLASWPKGIEANKPLLSGIYVDSLASCSTREIPMDEAHIRQRIISGLHTTWGYEGGCETRRTDISDGITLFRGTCTAENTSWEADWYFDVTSNESFIDVEAATANPDINSPRQFTRCPDDSVLGKEWLH